MTWQTQAMKDAESCDKLRGAASGIDPEISEWGNPVRLIPDYSALNKIEAESDTRRIETSK